MDYVAHIIAIIAIYALLACSLALLVGQAGVFSVAHAAFFGIGAYSSALLVSQLNVPVLIAVPAAVVITSSAAIVVASLSYRLRGDEFVLASFAFQILMYEIMVNWVGLTGGPLGISGIPGIGVGRFRLTTSLGCAVMFALVLVLAVVVFALVTNSPYGRALRGMSADDAMCQSLGVNTLKLRMSAFAASAAGAGLAGSLFAHYVTYIDPTSFGILDSIAILAMVIIGGSRTTLGAIVGATVFILFPEILRFVGLPGGLVGNVRQMLFGLLLVLAIVFRPHGLLCRSDRQS